MNVKKNAAGISREIVLVDLPTFPKGVLSLSLINVGTGLSKYFTVSVVDMNFSSLDDLAGIVNSSSVMLGLKVSSQNYHHAVKVSNKFKACYPNIAIVWGGELPTLLPDKCLEIADCIVSGLFEPIIEQFSSDLKAGKLAQRYNGGNDLNLELIAAPRFDLLGKDLDRYFSFMGLPLETSRGCTEKCTFCMVHTMQKKNYITKSYVALNAALSQYRGRFVNIVDYNFGVNRHHVIQVARMLKNAGVTGWMAEMCIEFLDDDELLQSLKESGCRMIYCGLETIDTKALASVHKMNTNHVDNYTRIIRKAQEHGIQIAAGIILGIENMNAQTMHELYEYYSRMGIIYAKLTFITYNPGTKAMEYMKKKGRFTSDNLEVYDGNHLSYQFKGVNAQEVYDGTTWFIKHFYSFTGIVKRSFNTKLSVVQRIEYILFNLCYREAYYSWLQYRIFDKDINFEKLLAAPLKKRVSIIVFEKILVVCRKLTT